MKKIISIVLIFLITVLFLSCNSTKITNSNDKNTSIENNSDDEEFSRSTQEVEVTKEVFSADKSAILKIISELSIIMTNYDYNSWIGYIDSDSIEYWSNQKNLILASKRLPYKNQRLYTLNDYFKMVFVPSRQGRKVDEIRYISLDSVKAVQMHDNQDIVYYNFIKKDNKWMVKLPTIQ